MGRRLWGMHVLIERIERQQLFDDARALDPVSMTLTGAALDVCDQLYQQQAGRCRVAVRDWPDPEWLKMLSGTWVERQMDRGYKHIARCTVNEPPANDDGYIRWMEDALAYCLTNPRSTPPLNVGLIAVGNPGDGVIESGRYDTVLRYLAESNGKHWLALHVYYAGNIYCDGAAGIMELKPSYDMARWNWDAMADWHVRRYERFIKRAEQLGLGPINIVFNEYGPDTLTDTQNSPDMQHLASQYNGGQALRGIWSGYQRLYPDMTGEDFDTFTARQWAWAAEHWHPWVKAIEPFVHADFDPGGASEKWATMYGITGRKTPRLWAWMCEQNKEAVPMAWKLATVSTNKRVNMRDDASTTATVLGQFTGSRQFYVFDNGVVRNSVHWALFSPNADGSQSFFMAKVDADGTQLLDIVYVTAPQPDPAPDEMTILMLNVPLAIMRAITGKAAGANEFGELWSYLLDGIANWQE